MALRRAWVIAFPVLAASCTLFTELGDLGGPEAEEARDAAQGRPDVETPDAPDVDGPLQAAAHVIASGQEQPRWIVLDDANVYWLNAGLDPTSRVSSVMRRARASGAAATPLASKIPLGQDLALDATRLYWVQNNLCGGPTGIGSVALIGGPATVGPALCYAARGVRVDVTNGWYLDPFGAVGRWSKLNGGSTPITGMDPGLRNLAIAAGEVYAADPPNQRVVTLSKSASAGPMDLFAANQNVPVAIVTDETAVYWVTDPGGTLVRLDRAKRGGTPTLLASALASPTALALDTTSVYVTTAGDGRVVRIPKSGGEVRAIAQGQKLPCGIAADDRAVYWANCADGTVWATER